MGDDYNIGVKISADASDYVNEMVASKGATDDWQESLASASDAADATGTVDTFGEAVGKAGESAKGAADIFSEFVQNLGGAPLAMASGVIEAEALIEVFRKLKEFVSEATLGGFEWAESLSNQAISTGIAADKLQILQYAAKVTGNDVGNLQMVVNRLGKAIYEFQSSGKPGKLGDAASVLGLNPADMTDAYSALMQIGDAVKRIGAESLSQAQRGALQEFIGGRGGMRLLPLITQLREFEDEAKATNQVVGEGQVRAMEEASAAVNRAGAAWDRLKKSMSEALAVPAEKAFTAVANAVNDYRNIPESASFAFAKTGMPTAGDKDVGGVLDKLGKEGLQAGSESVGIDTAQIVPELRATTVQLKQFFKDAEDAARTSYAAQLTAGRDASDARLEFERKVNAAAQLYLGDTAEGAKELAEHSIAYSTVQMEEVKKTDDRTLKSLTEQSQLTLKLATVKSELTVAEARTAEETGRIDPAALLRTQIEEENRLYALKAEASGKSIELLGKQKEHDKDKDLEYIKAVDQAEEDKAQHKLKLNQLTEASEKKERGEALVNLQEQVRLAEKLSSIKSGAVLEQSKTTAALGFTSASDSVQTQIAEENSLFETRTQWGQRNLELLRQQKGAESAEYIKSYDDMEIAGAQHAARISQLNNQLVMTTVTQYRQVGDVIAQAVDRSVQGILQGTQKTSVALRQMGQSMVLQFISFEAARLIKALATEAAIVMAHLTGNAIMKASDAATAGGSNPFSMKAMKQITGDAAQAYANVYAQVSQIPYIGWVLAPVAAGAAFAAVFAMGALVPSAAGGFDVPQDTLAMIHKNEVVLPASLAQRFRDSSEPGGGGETHHHWNISAIDASSFQKFARDNSGAFGDAFVKAHREVHPGIHKLVGAH